MKTINNLLTSLNAAAQSEWMRPMLMTLAFVVVVLGMTGCTPHH